MDQKIAAGGTVLTAILLFFCALLVVPLGLGMLLSFPDKIWWIGLVLLVCGFVFVKSGLSNLKQSIRMQKEADANINSVAETLNQVKRQTAASTIPTIKEQSIETIPNASEQPVTTTATGEVKILAHWLYTAEEWKKFTAWEIKERKTNTTIEASLIIVIGSIFVQWTKGGGWAVSIGISVFVAIIYWLGKYFLSMASIGKAAGKANEVVITNDAVIINGKYNAFRSEMYWLKKIEIKEEPTPRVMEIVYEWSTRKGPTHDEIRIPIPGDKLQEAMSVVQKLKGF